MEIKNSKEFQCIVLSNSTKASLKKSARGTDTFSTSMPGMHLYVPGSIVPVICKDGCPIYGKITSVNITESNTTVEFSPVDVSDDIANAAYSIYQMTSGSSVIGSYQSKSGSNGRYSLNDLPKETRNFFGFDRYDD